MATNPITGGMYLVLDPSMETAILLNKLECTLKADIQAVQIWNNWPAGKSKLALIEAIGVLCERYATPLFIDNDWELLTLSSRINGVHFDKIPADLNAINHTVGRHFLSGITCSGNLETVSWANSNNLDYVSFCAMFPSPSAGNCDIVMPETVKQARGLTDMPIFVSGGITPQNIISLKKATPFDGVAVISGILSALDPEQKVKQYKDALGIPPQ